MPLVRISLLEGKPAGYVQKAGDAVHRAMVETISVPAQDRFKIITEHKKSHLIYDPAYLNIQRSDDLLNQELKLRKEDVLISLVEVGKEIWSFGNGEAQYAT